METVGNVSLAIHNDATPDTRGYIVRPVRRLNI
jgi:hypothetical protein